MTCREMNGVLPGLAEREGTPRVALDAARHLASCKVCAEALLRLRATSGLLDRLPKAEVPAGFARRVLRALPVKGGALTILLLSMGVAFWGVASSLGSPLVWLSGALSESFHSATSTFVMVIRLALDLLNLARAAAGALELSPPPVLALSRLPLSHVTGLLFTAAVTLTVSGLALSRGRFLRAPSKSTAGQPIG